MKTLLMIVAAMALALPATADRSVSTTSELAPMTVGNGLTQSAMVSAIYTIDPSAPALTANWTTADGMAWSVTVPRRTGESAGNQAKRLNIAVKALVAEVGGPAAQTSGT